MSHVVAHPYAKVGLRGQGPFSQKAKPNQHAHMSQGSAQTRSCASFKFEKREGASSFCAREGALLRVCTQLRAYAHAAVHAHGCVGVCASACMTVSACAPEIRSERAVVLCT
eukprot:2305807-Pleurochrysis_carterae.AAC.1